MEKFGFLAVMVALLASGSIRAQEVFVGEDFLTEFEADLIRVAQQPSDRVPQYLEFAKLRIALVDQLLAKEEPGRGAKVHKNLDELGRIVEAIDMVIDDALVKEADLEKTIPELLAVEQDLLTRLEAIQDEDADDLWRYEFVLEDAIDILADSIEMTTDDPTARKIELVEAEASDKAAREETMTEARKKDMEQVEEGQEEEVRKRPSLLKEGENLDNQEKGRVF
jgi:hypothetical protein